MARAHSCQHVDHFGASDLPDDYTVRAHPQAGPYEGSDAYRSFPLSVCTFGLHAHKVFVAAYLKLRAVDFGLRSGKGRAEGFRVLGRTQMHCLPEAAE